MKFVTFGGNGRVNAYYDSVINTIPPNADAISDYIYNLAMTESRYGYIEKIGPNVYWTVAPPPPLSEVAENNIATAYDRINRSYEAAIDALTIGYPANEVASWIKQEISARAWLADNATLTPWIDAAATARGISKASFVAKIIENADAFAPVHGALTGKRQKLRDQIEALGPDAAAWQLDDIQW